MKRTPRRLRQIFPLLFLILIALSACKKVDIPANAVFYWQPTVNITQRDKNFLADQHVTAVYLHIFNIELDSTEQPVRVNTVNLTQRFPKGLRIIPVVFIDTKAMLKIDDPRKLGREIVNKTTEIMEANDYGTPNEILMDFAWSENNYKKYFELLDEVGKLIHQRPHGQLSASVHLYQLSMPVPPVDYAVLMIYNTGDKIPVQDKFVLPTYQAMKSHVSALKKYPLPFVTSLNLYGYDMIYSNNQFRCLARGLNLKDTTHFKALGDNTYQSLIYRPIFLTANNMISTGRLYPGDIVKHVQPSAGLIDSVASLISRVRPGDRGNIAIYQLDERCLANYSREFFKDLFVGGSMVENKDSWY